MQKKAAELGDKRLFNNLLLTNILWGINKEGLASKSYPANNWGFCLFNFCWCFWRKLRLPLILKNSN
jgi:hypothetical protein